MSSRTCPLCGREMTTIETRPGYGELYCQHCDLTIGANEAKTPEELEALFDDTTCSPTMEPPVPEFQTGCSKCGEVWDRFYNTGGWMGPPAHCPRCGRRVVTTEPPRDELSESFRQTLDSKGLSHEDISWTSQFDVVVRTTWVSKAGHEYEFVGGPGDGGGIMHVTAATSDPLRLFEEFEGALETWGSPW